MIKFTNKNIVSSLIATLAISSISLNAADYGSVNGEKITKEDIAIVLRNPNVDFDALPKKSKDKILEQIVERKLLTEKAIKSGLESDSEYKKALDKLKKDLALEIWMQKEYKKISVSNSEQKNYYNKNKSQFNIPSTLEARHILTKTEVDAKAIIKDLDKASKKKEKFIELAKTKSTGPSGPQGGYLGKFPETQMVPEFSKAAKSLGVGKYSKKPVKTQFGYHVIYLEGKNPASTMPYDKVKTKIKQVLIQEKFGKRVKTVADSLRKKAKIIIK